MHKMVYCVLVSKMWYEHGAHYVQRYGRTVCFGTKFCSWTVDLESEGTAVLGNVGIYPATQRNLTRLGSSYLFLSATHNIHSHPCWTGFLFLGCKSAGA
jgi:hypothetical protein